MEDVKYLLSIQELLEGERAGELRELAFARVDVERRSKAQQIKQSKARACSLGAGLLLQLAVREAIEEKWDGGNLRQYNVSKLLAQISAPLPFAYEYGIKGKPYFKNFPFFFSISHSGCYVFCVLSKQEIGADIQEHQKVNAGLLTRRFFSVQEAAALENCGDEALFFRLWARKEAYAKLTGKGIADTINLNLLPKANALYRGDDSGMTDLVWEEPVISGYSMAVCKYHTNLS